MAKAKKTTEKAPAKPKAAKKAAEAALEVTDKGISAKQLVTGSFHVGNGKLTVIGYGSDGVKHKVVVDVDVDKGVDVVLK